MKHSIIILDSKPTILRNGKMVTTKKNHRIQTMSVSRKKINNKLSFNKTSSNDICNLNVKNKNKIMMNSNYNHMLKHHSVIVLLTRLPPSIYFKDLIDDHINNNNKSYTKVENHINLNELQIYNTLEPKMDKCQKLTAIKETIQTCMTSNCYNKNSDLKAIKCDQSIVNHSPDVRITRRKTIQLKTEERKRLDLIFFDKYPKFTFRMLNIYVHDITKEAEFLRKLGLICRFKYPFTSRKIKKNI